MDPLTIQDSDSRPSNDKGPHVATEVSEDDEYDPILNGVEPVGTAALFPITNTTFCSPLCAKEI